MDEDGWRHDPCTLVPDRRHNERRAAGARRRRLTVDWDGRDLRRTHRHVHPAYWTGRRPQLPAALPRTALTAGRGGLLYADRIWFGRPRYGWTQRPAADQRLPQLRRTIH